MLDVLPYDDYLTVSRTTPGGQDPDTGAALSDTTVTILRTSCDVQDDTCRLRRSSQGDELREADAVIYLPSGADMTKLKEGDDVLVEYAHVLQPGKLVEIGRFDRVVTVRWV